MGYGRVAINMDCVGLTGSATQGIRIRFCHLNMDCVGLTGSGHARH